MATTNPSKLIFDQIETNADFYAPKVYALLNRFGDLRTEQETAEVFLPVTQTRFGTATGADAKSIMFVVGLLPPTSNVTGRLLDRSASVRDITGASTADIPLDASKTSTVTAGAGAKVGDKGYIVTADGYTVKQGTGSSSGAGGAVMAPPTFPTPSKSHVTTAQLWGLVYNAYVNIKGTPPTATEMQFYCVQIMRETGGQALNGNFGGIGNYPAEKVQTAPDGTTFVVASDGSHIPVYQANNGNGFNSYPSLEAGAQAFMNIVLHNDNAVQAAKDGDVMGYMTSLAQKNYFTESIQTYYETGSDGQYSGWARQMAQVAGAMAPFGVTLDDGTGLPLTVPEACAFHEDTFQYHNRIGKNNLTPDNVNRFKAGSPYDSGCELFPPDDVSSTATWNGTGSSNAKQFDAESAKLANSDFNRTDLGRRFLGAQLATIKATIQELEKMRNTPPLKLLVNPQSFKVSSEHIVNDGNWTRNGPIIEHWGPGQDKIEGSGKVSGFYAIDTNNAATPGLTRTARFYSAAYQNLMSLYLLYKNNGGLFLNLAKITGQTTEITRLSVVGSIYIYYDGILYFGSFDNFSITESDTSPFTLEYNFQFTVRSAFLLDRPLNPQHVTYGNTKIISGDPSLPTTSQTLEDQILAQGGGPVDPPPGTTFSGPFAGLESDFASESGINQSLLEKEFAETAGLGQGKPLPAKSPSPPGTSIAQPKK
jgi:hypothetical protein